MNKFVKPEMQAFRCLISKIPLTMRITSILLVCIFLQASAEPLYPQSTRISLDLKNVTVEEALNTIEERSEYYFLYNSKLVDVDRKVDVKAKDQLIFSILDGMFASTDVAYKVEDRQIILSRKDLVLADVQQTGKRITGKIVDQTGEPVVGANVVEKGTTNGNITDADGKFSLLVKENATLVISFVGYVTQEIAIG
ncbi:MAG: carboxypeptidase-like regulatory domain-containing protein, partial [Tannerella sp.]|nr:carboxypeptidase-like regulatory domain-containing protein [Tannerella sp.]